MGNRVTGTFDVKITPQAAEAHLEAAQVGRMHLDKQFNGALDATSKGVMLATSGSVKGSAGYVAIERVTGTLDGRSGSFALQHNGTMDRGAPSLTISVVPDTGTDALEGISGSMSIEITGGVHYYTFDYSLPRTT